MRPSTFTVVNVDVFKVRNACVLFNILFSYDAPARQAGACGCYCYLKYARRHTMMASMSSQWNKSSFNSKLSHFVSASL